MSNNGKEEAVKAQHALLVVEALGIKFHCDLVNSSAWAGAKEFFVDSNYDYCLRYRNMAVDWMRQMYTRGSTTIDMLVERKSSFDTMFAQMESMSLEELQWRVSERNFNATYPPIAA